MGGAVSSGRDNNELIDNLMGGGYIRTRAVERVFRVLDRADYMSPEARDQAHKDLAWRNGLLHLSAPCIYSEVMEALELKPGLSFLNLGSGTGYLSTLAGLILGPGGISHGVECYPAVIEYANKKLAQFLEESLTLDEFDFCFPKFYCGNALALAPLQASYDRVYCGAGVLGKFENHFKQLVKVGGVLVMPLRDTLVQLRRVSHDEWRARKLLNVSFALLRVPAEDDLTEPLNMEALTPPALQQLARGTIRACMRRALQRRRPSLRAPARRPPPAPRAAPRRVCIPLDAESDADAAELSELHDLDPASGANEMNALLSLVLSMGQNRVAGSLRLDSIDDFDTTPASSDVDGTEDYDDDDDEDGDDDDETGERALPASARNPSPPPALAPDAEAEVDDDEDGIRMQVRRSRQLGGVFPVGPQRSYRALRPCLRPVRTRRARAPPDAEPRDSEPVHVARQENAPSEVEVFFGAAGSYVGVNEEISSSDSSSSSERGDGGGGAAAARRRGSKRQKLDSGIGEGASKSSSPDKCSSECSERSPPPARRLQLSQAMKLAVKELPLPVALQQYVNLDRCADF